MDYTEIALELTDTEWPPTVPDHDRQIVRAIVFDADGMLYFVRVKRSDQFGCATLIETSGGGVEPNEDLERAIRRELKEELGAEVDVLARIGVVSDYYNLIRRHNINNYYLCRLRAFGQKHLTQDEIWLMPFGLLLDLWECHKQSTLKLTYADAVREYETHADTPLGRLIAQRELPILHRAKELIDALQNSAT